MDQTMTLDEKVKKVFGLFQGLRSEEEDKKIYEQIMEYFFEEISRFMVDNLSEDKLKTLMEELGKAENEQQKTEVMNKYMTMIDNYEFKLSARLDGHIDKLLIDDVVGKITG